MEDRELSTIRERDADFAGIPDMPPLTGPDSAQVRAYDRRALLAAGDALAEAAGWFLKMLDGGGPDGGDLDQAVEDDVRAELAAWKAATG